jgi:murein DD-endopeptidase MepM/ murein hydrolase activator NlpD
MLRSPLLFQPRVTSGFSRSRLHPVFRAYRAHLGVDYGAPAGSPVVAVAAGVVVSAGYSGGAGYMIRVRHAGGLESYYLHLSSFGRGVRAGAQVAQGQVIGRVGSTGTATGPHLDYRLRKNGVFVNPLVEQRRQPPGEPLTDAERPMFMKTRDTALAQLSATLVAGAAPAAPEAIATAPR